MKPPLCVLLALARSASRVAHEHFACHDGFAKLTLYLDHLFRRRGSAELDSREEGSTVWQYLFSTKSLFSAL